MSLYLKPFAAPRFKAGVERIEKNAFAFLETLGYAYDENVRAYRVIKRSDKKVALFAHEGVGTVFLSSVLGIPYPRFCTHFALGFCGYFVISFEGECYAIPKILQISEGMS